MSKHKHEGAGGPVQITAPADGAVQYAVINIAGQTTGTITVSGFIVPAQGNVTVYAKVVAGNLYTTATVPPSPLRNSQIGHTNPDGSFSIGNVGTASCAGATPFPANQALAWAYIGSGAPSPGGPNNFTGQCAN